MLDGILHFLILQIKQMGILDQRLILESDPWVIHKILKLSIQDQTYFKMFDFYLKELPFAIEDDECLKVSLFKYLKIWFAECRDSGYKKLLDLTKITVILSLIRSGQPKMKIKSIFEVAVQNNLQAIPSSVKELGIFPCLSERIFS